VGWAYCPLSIADILNRVRGPFNVSAPGILAASAAILDTEFTAKAKAHNDQWLPWLSKELTALGLLVYPSQGNFILVDFKSEEKANAANDYLMQEGIIPRKVVNYDLPSCLRITIGLAEENQTVVNVLEQFLRSQKAA
jgi:histidinol-phosphate aminotransferase